MSGDNLGIWLIGAWGHTGTALAVMLAALQRRLIATDAFTTEQPRCAGLGLVDWSKFALGGHEIRRTSTLTEARKMFADSQVVTPGLLEQVAPSLCAWDRNIRTGTLLNAGPAVELRAHTATLKTRGERPAAALRRTMLDLDEFKQTANLRHVIVVSLISTELPASPGCRGLSRGELLQMLEFADRSPIPTSSLYAVAAMNSGCSYLNFASSVGSDVPAVRELAVQSKCLHSGREARTDLASTGQLGIRAPTDIASCAEWLLAAAAALDLVRLCERAHRSGESGVPPQFACFFERPMEGGSADTASQFTEFRDWIKRVSSACA